MCIMQLVAVKLCCHGRNSRDICTSIWGIINVLSSRFYSPYPYTVFDLHTLDVQTFGVCQAIAVYMGASILSKHYCSVLVVKLMP